MAEAFRHALDPRTVNYIPNLKEAFGLGRGRLTGKVLSFVSNCESLDSGKRFIESMGIDGSTGVGMDMDRSSELDETMFDHKHIGIWRVSTMSQKELLDRFERMNLVKGLEERLGRRRVGYEQIV